MGFYPQPNDYVCGPFALKHALVTLGRLVDEDKIATIAKTHWWSGTDEIKLARAARAFDCDLPILRTRDSRRARRMLLEHLRRRIPVLLCVDDWSHWITAVRYEGSRFVVIDSNLDPVLNLLSWAQLDKRWAYLDHEYDENDPPTIYDLHPVRPRFRVTVKADLSIARLRYLRRPENRLLSLHWNEYLEDLLEICRPRSALQENPLSMGEFLRRNQELILSRVTYWHGEVDRERVAKLLGNFRFVAETYGLVIPKNLTRRAVADMAILVTMAVIAMRGIDDLYGFGT
ncbi:MAG TPA: hypothetical protein VFU21_13975 [Kofleriaceae bacterium]|nr:hypothetical protein [Kofleriaceae bacterium]